MNTVNPKEVISKKLFPLFAEIAQVSGRVTPEWSEVVSKALTKSYTQGFEDALREVQSALSKEAA